MDIPRIFNITESAHRIHNPITPEKLATLGAALRLESGARVLDLGSGSGEMLCIWARDHGVIGTGIDMSQLFTEQAKLRAEELGVAHQVTFIHGDAAGYVSDEKVGVAACVGATWIGGGVAGRSVSQEIMKRGTGSGQATCLISQYDLPKSKCFLRLILVFLCQNHAYRRVAAPLVRMRGSSCRGRFPSPVCLTLAPYPVTLFQAETLQAEEV
jgi:SAM-dependent methyltransferase